jgi:hypothetical protein
MFYRSRNLRRLIEFLKIKSDLAWTVGAMAAANSLIFSSSSGVRELANGSDVVIVDSNEVQRSRLIVKIGG